MAASDLPQPAKIALACLPILFGAVAVGYGILGGKDVVTGAPLSPSAAFAAIVATAVVVAAIELVLVKKLWE